MFIVVGCVFVAYINGGILVPIWMFINTIILVVHLPLIKSNMPSNIHYMLIHFLNIFRLNFKFIDDAVDKIFVNFDVLSKFIIEYEQKDTAFTDHLTYCNYKFNFFRNMVFFLTLLVVIGSVWLIMYAIDYVCLVRLPRKQ